MINFFRKQPVIPDHSIRLLDKHDGAAYQKVRLISLQTDPDSFTSLYESEKSWHETAFADHLDWSYHPPHFGYFGYFIQDELVGYVKIGKSYSDKQNHIAIFNNLYVLPEYRQQKVASQLFEHIFAVVATQEHIERLYLTCMASNTKALELYKRLGFEQYSVKVKSIKWQDRYDDEVEMVKVLVLTN